MTMKLNRGSVGSSLWSLRLPHGNSAPSTVRPPLNTSSWPMSSSSDHHNTLKYFENFEKSIRYDTNTSHEVWSSASSASFRI